MWQPIGLAKNFDWMCLYYHINTQMDFLANMIFLQMRKVKTSEKISNLLKVTQLMAMKQ